MKEKRAFFLCQLHSLPSANLPLHPPLQLVECLSCVDHATAWDAGRTPFTIDSPVVYRWTCRDHFCCVLFGQYSCARPCFSQRASPSAEIVLVNRWGHHPRGGVQPAHIHLPCRPPEGSLSSIPCVCMAGEVTTGRFFNFQWPERCFCTAYSANQRQFL